MARSVNKQDVAVIGMSCRFPGAANYEEFWENLKAGRSDIEEVPMNRWDWKAYWGDPQTEKNKSDSRWGGFLKGVDNFDPDFFGLSVKEVERMDPQQRIMLELAWSCFEDAAIRPSELSGKKVGVFLGVFNFDYKELQERGGNLAIEAHHSTGTASAIIANRISYYFNFTGPSLPIDTACSSSHSAIHSAIQSLTLEECPIALAGGVNLLLTPTRHISFAKTGMLSPTGSCKTFDDKADGYVRGEGAGFLLLKPLQRALQDKDHIYGIIKGSAVNHGGKTYSLTYPNVAAQAQVILEAQKAAGVTAETISYIEAHGTGTPKGDPIEFSGLLDAFNANSAENNTVKRKNYCGLGSVKTNIGHLEAAAGVAGIIKVLLSMKHRVIPGLQNFQSLNHRISLNESPFYLVTRVKEWDRISDANNIELPRRAGVSSFGFGGTNSHVILEEAPEEVNANVQDIEGKHPPFYLICISAKTGENLLQKQKDLAGWLSNNRAIAEIADLCKTLCAGREHFQKRTALIVKDVNELQSKLELLSNQSESEGCFTNLYAEKTKDPASKLYGEVSNLLIQNLSASDISDDTYYEKLVILAELYLKGYDHDWEQLWFGCKGRRISLPTYPFTKNSYWIPELELIDAPESFKATTRSTVNNLLGENTSNLRGQRFTLTLTGNESFLKDHVVKGRPMLPAVAYIEMVRAAVAESTKGIVDEAGLLCLENIIWVQPILVTNKELKIHTGLAVEESGSISFEIFSGSAEKDPVVYSRGAARFIQKTPQPVFNINALKEVCSQNGVSKQECYSALRKMGFEYGPAHQALETIYSGSHKQLVKLALPVTTGGIKDYYFHPGLMDAVLQACLLTGGLGDDNMPDLYLPFALDYLEMFAPGKEIMWAIIYTHTDLRQQQQAPVIKMDIDVCDEDGRCCVRMKGISFRRTQTSGIPSAEINSNGLTGNAPLLFKPSWRREVANAQQGQTPYVRHGIFLCEPEYSPEEQLKNDFPNANIITLQASHENIGERYQFYTQKLFEEVQFLLKEKSKGKILVQLVVFEKEESTLFAGLAGLLKTARLENPNFIGQLIIVPSGKDVSSILNENIFEETDLQIRYTEGVREVSGWIEVSNHRGPNIMPWKEHGVYLITGGTGGLGLIFAKEIVEKVKHPSLILIGRSPLNETQKSVINELRSTGAVIEHKQVDVTDRASVNTCIQEIINDYNGLNGIIHSAGIIKDNYIIKKTAGELVEVMQPKVAGVTWLDEATRGLSLDVFVLFSSVVASFGNAGQADYAAANAYMNEYAAWRNQLVKRDMRQGHTIAVNWPLWKEGGMQLEKEMEQVFLEQMKMNLLETDAALLSFYSIWASGESQVAVVPANYNDIKEKFLPQPKNTVVEQSVTADAISNEKAVNYFKKLLSEAIKRPAEQIEADVQMEQYGIDSIMVMQMTRQMEAIFGTLPKTLFFEYQNVQELTDYFIENHSDKLSKILGEEQAAEKSIKVNNTGNSRFDFSDKPMHHQSTMIRKASYSGNSESPHKDQANALDVAIIGLAGRYPGADNLQEFWDNLIKGKDCITEIPRDRWDYRLYFSEDKENEGKSYSKWGGFLNDVDKFDPLFFNISPSEAEKMDPQERLFLQCVYEAIEDAGYTRHSLGWQKQFGLTNQVGVYVGVMYEEYQLFGAQEALLGNPVAVWGLPSSIANRVSYFCNFHGPSMAVDTMCSSSLTAIHLACESIVRGKCEIAIAGGVNVSVHPNKYLFLSQGRFVSSKGRCESFGIGGDGYVPGEGVGAVLLKPLKKAIEDGDHVYGVIKSTAINHGGKTNGYTVPNLKAQASVIGTAFKEAGIHPRTISYIEAHGTGTSLGDPIEIGGLNKAISDHTTDTGFCAIGSVKSNIGHGESAAGIAGLTKVLLQLKHKKIVPSLHSAVLNANIDFTTSPFIVQQHLSEWKKPVVKINNETREYPLRAGISSFGAGGANAHILVEEYIPSENNSVATINKLNYGKKTIILLSAADNERLQVRAKQLVAAIRSQSSLFSLSDDLLPHVAYTLQVGREHMKSRLALLVTNINELAQKLTDFISGKQDIEGVVLGNTGSYKETEDLVQTIETCLKTGSYERVVQLWVNGAKPDWNQLYADQQKPVRISLPTYPFKKERYWIAGSSTSPVLPGKKFSKSVIHPLLHENISDLTGQRFTVKFSGNEFYLKDHKVNDHKVLPAAASLEMIREAVWQSVKSFVNNRTAIRLTNIIWQQPVIVNNEDVEVKVELQSEENGIIRFEVYNGDIGTDAEREIFCYGSAVINALPGISKVPVTIDDLKRECSKVVSNEAFYDAFERVGLNYGPSHKGLEYACIGNDKILAKISLPPVFTDKQSEFVLHPALLDAALQASLLWGWTDSNEISKMFLPVAMDELEIIQESAATVWALLSKNENLNNIDLLNEKGEYCIRLKGVVFKTPSLKESIVGVHRQSFEKWLLYPEWEKAEPRPAGFNKEFNKHIIIVSAPKIANELTVAFPLAEVLTLKMEKANAYCITTLQIFEKVQALLKTKEKGNMLVQVLVNTEGEGSLYTGISGLLKTAQKEYPGFCGQVIGIEENESIGEVLIRIRENQQFAADSDIRYNNGHRNVLQWKILNNDRFGNVKVHPWKNNGVYLITGGIGGLGFIFATEMARYGSDLTIVLTGRSPLNDSVHAKVTELEKQGAHVIYKQCNITDEQAVTQLIQSIFTEFGSLNGIIHSAGIVRDNFLINKTALEWNEVLSPKVNGIQNLDLASRNIPLDFFVFFSSVTGALGNAGQADYATANAFMDEYAVYRNHLVAKSLRHGHTLSVNWPLWAEGGMHVDKEAENDLFENMGIVPLPTDVGIEGLYQGLFLKCDRVMVVYGDAGKMQEKIVLQQGQPAASNLISDIAEIDDKVREEAPRYFAQLLSSVIKLPADQIRPDVSMEEYGIDSVMVMKMTGKLEKVFGALSKTLFFEYQNIRELANYFLQHHYTQLAAVIGLNGKKEVIPTTAIVSAQKLRRYLPEVPKPTAAAFDIAIVGVSGKYPQADNLDAFWKNLCQGKDCVTEIPESRWNYNLYFDADKGKTGKTYSKWGGFLNSVDHFDPLFFNISPKEAELIDPQERLFLQCAYETVEDAGYSRTSLSWDDENGLAGNVGVYVGVMYEEYQLFGIEESKKGRNIALSASPSSIANRVSYFYNFNGPSMAIDTMCSSSLTAVHLACQAIHNGDCKAAIAGGVNISIHPNKYLLLAQGRFISSKGRCESFGVGADGYVPAEGVGAVFLKPLAQAIADNDHVYGVIKATAVNHGGKTNGYTVPNPNAQAKVIKKAYEKSGIDPRTISYLEAHGTGTSLGDPIEITGLKKAYQEFTKDNRFCAIGSVKSNIGHAESAAGIAGLTKIILQLKHRQLVPTLHAEELNPNIDFVNSPFVIQQELAEWKRPVIGKNGQAKEFLRRAGISSFGAGGSNAHVIIEEFEENTLSSTPPSLNIQSPVIIVLSAKNSNRLHELIKEILQVLQEGRFKDSDLPDIAFTLQTGREALDARMAMVVSSVQELSSNLQDFIKGEAAIDGLCHGKAERENGTIDIFTTDDELKEVVGKWMERKKYTRLCDLWVKGLTIDWRMLYKSQAELHRMPKRVSLPTYPFARESYWVSSPVNTGSQLKNTTSPLPLFTFEEKWIEQTIEEAVAGKEQINRIVCFLSHPERQKAFRTTFLNINPGAEIIFISPDNLQETDTFSYSIDAYSTAAYKNIIRTVAEKYGKIDAFVYLWTLENPKWIREYAPIVHLLQALGAEKIKNCKVLLAGQWSAMDNGLNRCYFESWIGFVRSIGLVMPDTQVSVLFRQVADVDPEIISWTKLLWQELQLSKGHEALYEDSKRYTYQVQESMPRYGMPLIKQNGTYLITGGLGALGLIFAQHLVEKYNASLVLTGRSSLNKQKQVAIDGLKRAGNTVIYLQADSCDEEKMKEGLTSVLSKMGPLNGLVHAAGIEEEGSIMERSMLQFESIVASKVTGTLVLDELLKDEALDFVCYFSSSSAVLGDFGSCDYAVGNRFQTAFAKHRDELKQRGLRKGKTLAINWPLWRNGGMNLKEEDSIQLYLRSSGQRYLETQEGLEMFEKLLTQEAPSHQLVLAGDVEKLYQMLRLTPAKPSVKSLPQNSEYTRKYAFDNGENEPDTAQQLETDIKQYISELLKISVDLLDTQANFADLGFDSVSLTQFAALLSNYFDLEIVPALFFNFATIEKLCNYFISEHGALISGRYKHSKESLPDVHIQKTIEDAADVKMNEAAYRTSNEPIAIIGMSGRFPQARTIEEMWQILAEGRNAVSEIPSERFDWRRYYGGEKVEEGKTNCKWTGFIPGIREFDPLFFEISPSEAKFIDPRQRLLLQEGWKALEDAGYGKEQLEKIKVALYVGVEEGYYGTLAAQTETVTGNHNGILAARLSYFLNLSGANMAINTACSSGLVATHLAFQSLQNGECDMAIAAGVNLMITPEPYIAMSQAGMLSPDGACHTFDKRANGMVPGEAVAVVVLKRLSLAIADGDPIYATVTASGINYDGKTNGITAPGGLSQTELLRSVYDKYQIAPDKIEHIITHGTGTRLGDPVEINALYEAFKGHANRQGYCALTSVKTNFGHTFAASGLVSLISMVQALRNEKIPPSLNCQNESDYITWDKSPFFVNKALKPWPAVPGQVRVGAVSAFGMSGTNAHVVVQSFDADNKIERHDQIASYLLPLSAKTNEALQEKIRDMVIYLESANGQATSMTKVSYTLMAGRHHFKYRCAIIADDRDHAIRIFKLAMETGRSAGYMAAEVSKGFKEDRATKARVIEIIEKMAHIKDNVQAQKEHLFTLADFYCQGYDLSWEKLFPQQKPARVHLPSYPFSKNEYWIDTKNKQIEENANIPVKKWLFSREDLAPAPVQKEIDWKDRLSGYIGKRICFIYVREKEKEVAVNLLNKLQTAGNIQEKLSVTYLHIDDIVPDTIKRIRPEIVLMPGLSIKNEDGLEPVEVDIAPVFQLSKVLMQACWDEPVDLFYLFCSDPQSPRLDGEAVCGLLSSAMKENDLHRWKVIRLYNKHDLAGQCQMLIKELLLHEETEEEVCDYVEIHYKDGQRYKKQLIETELPAIDKPVFRVGGNYLIVGGTGYIGGLLLEEVARKYKANLFVVSRSSYNDTIKKQCRSLEEMGAVVYYFSADASDLDSITKTFTEIKSLAGEVHGVINLARAHDTSIIAAKSWESFYKVSLVKISSALNLDKLTAKEPLDFFMMFSAMAAFGAGGESDYAYSCAFLNAFVKHRNRLREAGIRSGIAVAQCWGPWTEDKLFPGHIDKWTKFGCDFVDMHNAFPLIEATCLYPHGDIGINAVGDTNKIKSWFGIGQRTLRPKQSNPEDRLKSIIEQWEEEKRNGNGPDFGQIKNAITVDEMNAMNASLVQRMYNLCFEPEEQPAEKITDTKTSNDKCSEDLLNVTSVIRTVVIDVLQIESLDNDEHLQNYGLDSIKAMRLSTRLEKKLHIYIQPQWFIEFPTINELSQHLATAHPVN